jgi:hypothetical protein
VVKQRAIDNRGAINRPSSALLQPCNPSESFPEGTLLCVSTVSKHLHNRNPFSPNAHCLGHKQLQRFLSLIRFAVLHEALPHEPLTSPCLEIDANLVG